MNENAKAWIEALRSGKFEQTQGWLRNHEGYCCLGVACELALEAGIIEESYFDDNSEYASYDGEDTELPEVVAEWLGLTNPAGRYEPETPDPDVECWGLTWDNDKGKTFDEIADIIENQPPGLFS